MKLTKPQKALLESTNNVLGCRSICTDYKPAIKLVELGLAKFEQGRFTDYLVLTATGRAEANRLRGET